MPYQSSMSIASGDLFGPAVGDLIAFAVFSLGFTIYLFWRGLSPNSINLWLAHANNFLRLILAVTLFVNLGYRERSDNVMIFWARTFAYIFTFSLFLLNCADFLLCCPTGYVVGFFWGGLTMFLALATVLSPEENARIAFIVLAAVIYSSAIITLFLSRHRSDIWAWLLMGCLVAIGACYLGLITAGHAWRQDIGFVGETWGVFGVDIFTYGLVQLLMALFKQNFIPSVHKHDDSPNHQTHYGYPLNMMPTQWMSVLPPEHRSMPVYHHHNHAPPQNTEEYYRVETQPMEQSVYGRGVNYNL